MKIKIGKYPDRWISRVHTNHMEKKYGFLWGMDECRPIVPTRFDNSVEVLEDCLQTLYNWSVNLIADRQKQTVKVHIDKWDTWSMDHTLAPIIHPMLIQLKATNHGAPNVSYKDVPKELRQSKKQSKAYDKKGDVDDKHFERWNWIMDEMIWAFEQKLGDDGWEQQYYKYEDIPVDDKSEDFSERLGLKLVWEDNEGREKHQERMSNGFRLFGVYFENLWD
jgi:hypothetical protein